ncbi:MAG: hypothetical protein DMG28_13260 [Acidobacteria bacterium]|nr:MAG: hypothetical protein DMG28_13260 [Acidobacteriota bacterium]
MPLDERRLNTRLNLKVALRFRPLLNPTTPEQRAETVNLSPRGAYFATDYPLKVGTPVEMFLKMPRELTGQAPTDLRCTARVVHIEPNSFQGGKAGVGVHIERYETVATTDRETN